MEEKSYIAFLQHLLKNMDLSTDKLLTIINSISDGVFTVDLDYRINFINKSALRILKINENDAIGKKCHDIMHTNKCNDNCPLKETIRSNKPVINKPLCISPDDRRIPVSISTAVLRDDGGKVIGGVESFRDLSQVEALRKELGEKYTYEDMFGKSNTMQQLFDLISVVAPSDSTVLIEGESGSGKELIARAIHAKSKRKNKPMITVNCSALPDTLFESELFGYVAGAFTDAKKDKKGRLALAEGGTVFLDEIGELSNLIQVKLLRVLQDRKFEPLGSNRTVSADVRVITATNKNLEKLVQEKKFREDFYYRINVVKIKAPPLRKRKEDLSWLIDHFIVKYNRMHDKRIEGISPHALSRLIEYDFPGNVRELENIIEHACVLSRSGMIRPEHLPEKFQERKNIPAIEIASNFNDLEAVFLISLLKKNDWNRKKTAEELNINPSTLYRKFKKLGIKPPKK